MWSELFRSYARKEQRALRANHRIMFPHAGNAYINRLNHEAFSKYATIIIDRFRALAMPPERARATFVGQLTGVERVDQALSHGHGVIMIAAHLGAFELGGLLFSRLDHPLVMVAQSEDDPGLQLIRQTQRQQSGAMEVISGQGPATVLKLRRALLAGGITALLGDRAFDANTVRVRLFGKEVTFPAGPFLLALLSQAPLLPTFFVAQRGGKYLGALEEPFWVSPDLPRELAIRKAAQRWAVVLERYLQRYPSQWFNYYPFFIN